MRRLAAALVIASLALLGAVANARSEPRSFTGTVWVGIKGWGSVKPGKGVVEHVTLRCTAASCSAQIYEVTRSRIVLTAKAYKGWRFTGWHGACQSKKPTCVINATHAQKDILGERSAHVGAKFVPFAPGLTPGHPLPIGTAANIGADLVVKVDSANSIVQLSPAAPAGAEYFDANLTVIYTGEGSQVPNWFGFSVEGSHHATYETVNNDSCPYPGPQPRLDVTDPLYSYAPITGYVCWTIAANDASTLELYFGDGTLNYPGTIWFALH